MRNKQILIQPPTQTSKLKLKVVPTRVGSTPEDFWENNMVLEQETFGRGMYPRHSRGPAATTNP